MQPVTYTARDGLVVHGYLTLPVGVEAKNLPLIVNPHGGPWVRDDWGFDPEVQLLANRGYAVLQMNYRGSTGYGRKFWEAGFGQWGKAMQDDITDGVQEMIKRGVADPKRVGIYGGSYGGYATLAGVAFTPDLYNRGCRLCRRLGHSDADEDDPALLGIRPQADGGDDRLFRHAGGHCQDEGDLAAVQRRQDQDAAADRPGRA